MKVPLKNNGNKPIMDERKIFDLQDKTRYIVPVPFMTKYACTLHYRSYFSSKRPCPLCAKNIRKLNLDEKSNGIGAMRPYR